MSVIGKAAFIGIRWPIAATRDVRAQVAGSNGDEGDPRWIDLWTDDGVLDGIMPETVTGRSALAQIPQITLKGFDGLCRHHLTSVSVEEDADGGAIVRAYNLVTDWHDGGRLILNARYTIRAVRSTTGWKIKRVDAKVDR